MSEAVGAIAGLWRFPVKSMPGERLDEAEVTERGVVGDRAYALIEVATGKVVSGKNPRQSGRPCCSEERPCSCFTTGSVRR